MICERNRNLSARLVLSVFAAAALWTAPSAAPCCANARAAAAPFEAPEIACLPTDHSVAVSVAPTADLEAYVEYGAAPGRYTERTQAGRHSAGQPFEIVLDDLPTDSRVYYRLRYREPGSDGFESGAERSAHTQRALGTSFVFDVQGDSHPERTRKQFDAALYERTLANAAADRPDFCVLLGDDFSVDRLATPTADAVRALYVAQRRWLSAVGAPLFLVNGNHEQASLANLNGTPDNVAVWAQNARNTLFPQPAPDAFYSGDPEPVPYIGLLRDYYAFAWGDALFVVIDPYWHSPEAVDNAFGDDREPKAQGDLWKVTLGETQYEWFRSVLETSRARHRFVFAHHVNGTGRGGVEVADGYEWGGRDANRAYAFDEKRPGWGRPIHDLMADNSVTIFFQGHDHIFVRQELGGVTYQTLPEPADPNYSLLNADAFSSGDELPNSGHLRVRVDPERVTVEYVRAYLPADEKEGRRNGEAAYAYDATIPFEPEPPATHRAYLPFASAPAGTVAPPSPTPTRDGPPPTPTREGPPSTPTPVEPPPPGGFPGTVILGAVTDRSVLVSLMADIDLDARIEYASASGDQAARTDAFSLRLGEPSEVSLGDLRPDTAYIYRVQFRAPGGQEYTAAPERSFHTQRPPGSTFTFTLDADPHNRDPGFNPDVFSAAVRNAVADRPDFNVDLGDTFMGEKLSPGAYADIVPTYVEMRRAFDPLASTAPLFLVNGNHDGELGWRFDGTPESLAAWATRARREYYPNPEPGGFFSGSTVVDPVTGVRDRYYAWTWGDALFVVLDPFWYTERKPRPTEDNWGWTLGREQHQWLAQTLRQSESPYKFVFAHNLVGGMDANGRGGIEAADKWEWGGRNADGSPGFQTQRPGWEAPIHDLLVESRVTILFHGHDHLFVKQDLDGVVYQECPQPSYTSYDRTGSAAEYGYVHGEIQGCCGHLRVTVGPRGVTVDYVRAYRPADENAERRNGRVSYSYSVPPPVGRLASSARGETWE